MPNEDIFSRVYPSQQQQRSMFPAEISLAMAYIPLQQITTVYDDEVAFKAGTLFPELDKPFLAGRGA